MEKIVFDEKGEQIPELRKPRIKLFRNFPEEQGVDPVDIKDDSRTFEKNKSEK